MQIRDDFSSYNQELLAGRYDCVDRIVLNGYFPLGQQGGGFRTWWRQLHGSDDRLNQKELQGVAGRFSRRVHAWARKNAVPIIHCKPKERKHELAEKYLPQDTEFKGLFLILAAKAPALVWNVTITSNGQPHLERKTPWPYVNHYHFHIIDPNWGHITIKMSGYPPYGIQVMLNGHEWVERKAIKQTISLEKEGNCFVGGSFQALDQLADTLCDHHAIGRLTKVCDRWIFTSCLCFGLDLDQQKRSNFHYLYSVYQLEYSRNLLFQRGTVLDSVYQGLIDRTRRHLDVKTLRTVCNAVLALAPKPAGFTIADLTNKIHQPYPDTAEKYSPRQAAYDLMKLRGKQLVQKVVNTRNYCVQNPGIRVLAALITLREKVIKPVLAGAGKPRRGPKPKRIHPIDQHYLNLQEEMRLMLVSLGIVA